MARSAPGPVPWWVARLAPSLAAQSVTAPARISAVACVAAAIITGIGITGGTDTTAEQPGGLGDFRPEPRPLNPADASDPAFAPARESDMTFDEATLDALRADPRVAWSEDVLRFGDTDMNGHVNNATFAVLCESGRVNLFRTRLGHEDGKDTFFVIAKLVIEFRGELYYPGPVRTGTWVRHLGRTSLGLAQVLLDGDRVAATSEAVCVHMDGATRRPAPFPSAMREIAERGLRPDPA
jgi:acyl-CoA thioester hydrolase